MSTSIQACPPVGPQVPRGGWAVIVLGVDAHKRSHTVVAVDGVGRKLGERTVAATPEGHLAAPRTRLQVGQAP